jgi:hypothetical protein
MIEDAHGPGSAIRAVMAEVAAFARHHGLQNTFQYGDRRALFPSPA